MTQDDVNVQPAGPVVATKPIVAMLEMDGRLGGTCVTQIDASPRDSWDDFVKYAARHHPGFSLRKVHMKEPME